MARKLIPIPITIPLLLIFLLHLAPPSSAQTEADALDKFKASLTKSAALSNWTIPNPPCTGEIANYVGVLCLNGTVSGLQLQSLGLEGIIDVAALALLPNLKVFSIASNNFDGPLPNLAMLPNLQIVSVSNNKFSGVIPANAFQGMTALISLDMDDNLFSGPIPTSLASLPMLLELKLQNNRFQGQIPEFPQGQLRNFSVANNNLAGEIPHGVSNLEASAFDGNRDLCGTPLALCENPRKRLTVATIILLSILIASASSALIVVIIILCRRREPHHDQPAESTATATAASGGGGGGVGQENREADLERMERGELAPASAPSSPRGQAHQRRKSEANVKITFLREGREVFDMTDLMKASAEILGSGIFGSSYKAALTENQIVVVKRYRHMGNVSKQDFTEHMRRLGRLSHPNVLPLIAFYYRREEKLLVYDYVDKASLAALLHADLITGNRSRGGRKSPDWPMRLSITKGIARGLLYLHNELPNLTAAHGHLKSSNVILGGDSYTPSLTDYGLVPIVNQEHAEQHMISYRSPEYKRTGRITKKTDVWSLGILIIEIVTGRLPSNFLKQGKDAAGEADAAAWVELVAMDEENGVDVFDADMGREKESEGEMRKLLKIGFACCRLDVEERPDIKEVAQKIEEVREREESLAEFVVDS